MSHHAGLQRLQVASREYHILLSFHYKSIITCIVIFWSSCIVCSQILILFSAIIFGKIHNFPSRLVKSMMNSLLRHDKKKLCSITYIYVCNASNTECSPSHISILPVHHLIHYSFLSLFMACNVANRIA